MSRLRRGRFAQRPVNPRQCAQPNTAPSHLTSEFIRLLAERITPMQNLAYKIENSHSAEPARNCGNPNESPDVCAACGEQLGSIETGVPTANLAWGEDGSSLFITSNTNVFRLKLTTKGAGF